MKTNMLTMASAAALTMSLALPVHAATTALSDAALDAVSGKANSSTVGSSDNTTVSATTTVNGNIQVGYYQWDDNHAGDTSLNKGGNLQSGNNSAVQQNGTAITNTLAWGAVSQAVTNNTASIGSSQAVESWATMYIGGF